MLTEKQEEALYTINSYTYEQYDGIWCKALMILDHEAPDYDPEHEVQAYYSLKGYRFSESDRVVQNYLKQPFQVEHGLSLIQVFLEDALINFTPESFCYHYRLKEANWTLISRQEAIGLMDQLLAHSKTFLQKMRQKAAAEITEHLQYFGFASKAAYDNSSPEEQAKVDLPQFYENYGFTPEGGAWIDFDDVDHDELRTLLLNEWWDQESTHFFSSVALNQVATSLETEEEMVGIIGMDSEKMAFIWFNY